MKNALAVFTIIAVSVAFLVALALVLPDRAGMPQCGYSAGLSAWC